MYIIHLIKLFSERRVAMFIDLEPDELLMAIELAKEEDGLPWLISLQEEFWQDMKAKSPLLYTTITELQTIIREHWGKENSEKFRGRIYLLFGSFWFSQKMNFPKVTVIDINVLTASLFDSGVRESLWKEIYSSKDASMRLLFDALSLPIQPPIDQDTLEFLKMIEELKPVH